MIKRTTTASPRTVNIFNIGGRFLGTYTVHYDLGFVGKALQVDVGSGSILLLKRGSSESPLYKRYGTYAIVDGRSLGKLRSLKDFTEARQ